MSAEDLGRYVERMRGDPALMESLRRHTSRSEADADERIAEHARSLGFAVQAGDVTAARRALEAEGELNDGALDAVAGGGFADWFDKAFTDVLKAHDKVGGWGNFNH